MAGMNVLVLGGTAWLGHAIAAEAVDRGHLVTCLARGRAGDVASGARLVHADREQPDAYAELVGERWDAVVDVARQPGQVRNAIAALEPSADHFLFVSSANVYASQRELDQDETAPLLAPLAGATMASMEDYGPAKVACEQAVIDGFGPSRTLIARLGLIGGPGDWSGRSGYWPWRFANPARADGGVLVPDSQVPTGVIDVRDVAGWLVRCAEVGTNGTFDVGANRMPLAEHLEVARQVAGHRGPLVRAAPEWLAEHGVENWMGPRSLPLWLSDPDWFGMNARDGSRAKAAGLAPRPLHETLADTLAWELDREEPGPHGAGLTDADERKLLEQHASWKP